ncbi:hypothetical protein Tsubulata_044145 [Turnera subulata]|uniref:Uncharacterized protein n=1 Tax=Turnera subulata TaxID=218843 RepID=A0A9Q0FEG4_9ROSI|nr:hypothetical protein Tsubulata_044145 [Turnera subulata]
MTLSRKAVTQTCGCFGSRGSMHSNFARQIKPMSMIMPAASIHAASPGHHGASDSKRPVALLSLPPRPLEYEGNLVDGIIYNYTKRLFPPTWSLDDEVGRIEISRQWGAWAPPTDADIDRFFSDIRIRLLLRPSYRAIFTAPYRQVLISYFREMRHHWGFEVSSFPDYECLDIIRPAHEFFGGTPDDYTSALQPPFEEDLTVCEREHKAARKLDTRKRIVRMSFITAVRYITAITGHNHEPIEMICVNKLYPAPPPRWSGSEHHFYLTFIARNLSTGLSQTFQAVVSCHCPVHPPGCGYDYRCHVHYIRLKPNAAPL